MGTGNRTTRRHVLRQMAGAIAASAFLPSVARAQEGKPTAPESPATAPGAVIVRESNGAEVHQVTTERLAQSNIYCEIPYSFRDSRYFVYQRTNPALKANRTELMVVELGTWKEHRLDVAATLSGCAVSPDGLIYYLRRDGKELTLMRADLAQGSPKEVYRRKDGRWVRSLGTVTSDGRYYAGGVAVDEQNQMFGVMLLDLQKGQEAIIDRDPCIFNAHPQFEPGQGKWLMIQHNRGGKIAADGKIERLVGPEGATLYVLSVPDGKRTELPLGKPHTTPCTGHEAWIGTTSEIILTVSARGDFAPEKGNLLAIGPGGAHRVVAKGYACGHVGATRCGRLFSADDCRGTYNVVIGSTQTGRTAVVCASKTSPTRDQSTHVHPYLTPDLKWAIFNSNRSGWPHVHAARIPDEIVKGVLT